MKKAITIVLLTFFFLGKNTAQFEVKTETLGLLLGQYYMSVEYLAPNNLSIELGAGGRSLNVIEQKGSHMLLMVKYYFRTFRGHDELYIGGYGKTLTVITSDLDPFSGTTSSENIRRSGMAFGGVVGRKWRWFGNENITIDFQVGLGRFYGREVRSVIAPSPTPFFFSNESDVDVIYNFTVGYRFTK